MLEVLSKMEFVRIVFLRWSNSFELLSICLEKRLSKSIDKTNEFWTFWSQWPFDAAICVSRSCFFFLLKWCASTSENSFSEGEAYFWSASNAFGAMLTDVWCIMYIFFFFCEFQWNWWFRRGFYLQSGLSEFVKHHVQVEYASEGAKTAFTKPL